MQNIKVIRKNLVMNITDFHDYTLLYFYEPLGFSVYIFSFFELLKYLFQIDY